MALGLFDDFLDYKKAFTYGNKGNFSWITEFHKTDERIRVLMEQFNNYI